MGTEMNKINDVARHNNNDLVLNELKAQRLVPTETTASADGGIGHVFVAENRYASIECLNSGDILCMKKGGTLNEPTVWRADPANIIDAVERIRLFVNNYQDEIHDENGPTGQFIDVREVRMGDDGFWPNALDDGIRETVMWLRANGFKTFDSGDGKKDHPCAHNFPNVWMEVTRENAFAETDRLGELLEHYGIELNPDGGASLDMTYEPRTQPVIRLFGVDDELLRKHGVIGRTAPL